MLPIDSMEDFVAELNGETPTDPAAAAADPAAADDDPAAAGADADPAASEAADPAAAADAANAANAGADNTSKKNKENPIASLRKAKELAEKEKNKIEAVLNRLTEGDYSFKLKDFKNDQGKIDYDKLSAEMDAADVKKRAETRGLTPEMQAEIEKYEQEKKAIEREKLRIDMDRKLNSFQAEMNMTAEQLNLFISEAAKLGINPLSIAALDKTSKGTVALKYLHTAINHEKLVKAAVDKAVAEARAKWEADLAATANQPKGNPAKPNASQTNQPDAKGLALDEFLKTL